MCTKSQINTVGSESFPQSGQLRKLKTLSSKASPGEKCLQKKVCLLRVAKAFVFHVERYKPVKLCVIYESLGGRVQQKDQFRQRSEGRLRREVVPGCV